MPKPKVTPFLAGLAAIAAVGGLIHISGGWAKINFLNLQGGDGNGPRIWGNGNIAGSMSVEETELPIRSATYSGGLLKVEINQAALKEYNGPFKVRAWYAPNGTWLEQGFKRSQSARQTVSVPIRKQEDNVTPHVQILSGDTQIDSTTAVVK